MRRFLAGVSSRKGSCTFQDGRKWWLLLLQPATCMAATVQQWLGGLYLELFAPDPSTSLLPLDAMQGLPPAEDLKWEGFLWAVPKKRTSHSKKRMRSAHKYLRPRCDFIPCPKCSNLKLMHVLCGHCLKETLKKTAAVRQAELEAKLQMAAERAKRIL